MGFLLLAALIKIVGVIFLIILPFVNYSVFAERRVSAFIQDRPGPNRVGPLGLLQPLADAGKFLLKEDYTPAHVNKFYYWLAPCLAVIPAILTIAVVPFGSSLFGVPMVIADINVGVLYVFAIAWCLWNCARWLVVEFQIPISRWRPFHVADDLV